MRDEVLAWMAENGAGAKAASKHFGLSVNTVKSWSKRGGAEGGAPRQGGAEGGARVANGGTPILNVMGGAEGGAEGGAPRQGGAEGGAPQQADETFESLDVDTTMPEGARNEDLAAALRGRRILDAIPLDRDAAAHLFTAIEGNNRNDLIACAWVFETAWKTRMAQIGAVRGLGKVAADIMRIVGGEAKRHAKEASRRAAAQRVERPEQAPRGRQIFGPNMPRGLVVPEPWLASPTQGLVKESPGGGVTRVAYEPIWVTGVMRDVGSGAVYWVLEYPYMDEWTVAVVPRGTGRDHRKLLADAELANAPVDSVHNKDLVEYLSAFEAANVHRIPVGRCLRTLGWQGDRFFLGRTMISADEAVVTHHDLRERRPSTWKGGEMFVEGSAGTEGIVAAYHTAGDAAVWVAEVLGAVDQHPAVVAAIYASFASVLLHHIPQAPAFVLELAGETSHGKSTALRAAASVWGDPSTEAGLLFAWASTPVWLERAAALLQHLPLILDDTAGVEIHHRDRITRFVYNLVAGRGKGRGTVTSVQTQQNYRCLLLSSGEQPITSFSRGAGGAAARSIVLEGAPFDGPTAAADATRVRDATMVHYGHAGQAWVRWIIEHIGERPTWQRRYEQLRAEGHAAATSPGAKRQAEYIALLELTAELLEQGLRIPVHHAAIDRCRRAAQDGAKQIDVAGEAFAEVYSWAVSHADRFYGRFVESDIIANTHPKPPSQGWLGRWKEDEELAVLPDQLRDVLEPTYSLQACLTAWARRGWIRLGDGKHTKCQVRIAGIPVRCVVFTLDAIRSCAS